MAESRNGNGTGASAEVVHARSTEDAKLTLIELSPGAVLILPTKLLKDLCALQTTSFYGRSTLIFEEGHVVRSEMLVMERYSKT